VAWWDDAWRKREFFKVLARVLDVFDEFSPLFTLFFPLLTVFLHVFSGLPFLYVYAPQWFMFIDMEKRSRKRMLKAEF